MDDVFPASALGRIAAAARTLEENFYPALLASAPRVEQGLPAAWQSWGEAVAPGFPEAFALRLTWDGFTPVRWRAVPDEKEESLPAWTTWLYAGGVAARELASDPGRALPSMLGELFTADDPDLPPFAELWLPFLKVGREALSRRLPPGVQAWFSVAAWREAERDFLGQVGALADRCAFGAFDRFRAAMEPAGGGDHPSSRVRYECFVHRSLADGLVEFFLEAPVLARQVCRFTEDWVENLAEMLRRLEDDAEALAQQYSVGEALGPVVALRPGLSDRHHGGRQAAALTFANGARLLYKPKDLRQDAALAGWSAWFAARGLGEENVPPVARVLSRGGEYGWAEFIAGDAVQTPDEAARYYRRAGVLLAFVHALGGNDCVMDNVIATRRGPVLIDVETLFQPRAATAAEAGGGGALRGARQMVGDSVLRTGLLPTWQRTPDGSLYDVSGLAGEGGQDTGYRRLAWRGLNTDAMRPERETIRRPPQANLPRDASGAPIAARDHLDALEEGFRRAVDAMVSHRAALLGPDGLLLRLFAGCRTRFLLRPTYVYSVLLQSWSPPSRWRSGAERGMGFECLVRPFVQRASPGPPPPLWPVLRQERKSLERHDIPHFLIAAGSADLVLTGSGRGEETEEPIRVPGVFAESGLDAAAERLRGMSRETLEAQVGFLRAAFLRPREGTGMVGAAAPVPESRTELDATAPLDAAGLLAWAGRLADQVAAAAVPSGEAAVVWLSPHGLRLDEEARRGGNLYLYDGNCGVALFLAAVEAVSGGARSDTRRELIARACRPVTGLLESSSVDETAKGPGICVGVGAAVYTFTRIAGFLGDPAYLERAERMATLLTPERIAADRAHDVFHGTAGAILALLALHRATGEGTVALQTALRCGRHLVSHQQPARAGGAAWAVVHGWMPVGLAHGAAGIALALARLGVAAGTDEFMEPVRQALSYERALYRADALNWPVVNVPDGEIPPSPVFLNAWCNGAAGIGLSRLAMLDLLPAEDAADNYGEIEAALRKNRLGGLPKVDFPCCGNFGRIEFLHAAGRRLARLDAEDEARRRATLAVRRAEANDGRFSLGTEAGDDRCFQPGFFRGLAGIGYGLLRVAEPEKTPSVLLFE